MGGHRRRSNNEYSVNFENGHSYFKLGSASTKHVDVVAKKPQKSPRSLLNEKRPSDVPAKYQDQQVEDSANVEYYSDNVDEYDPESEHLIELGTITEFLKL